MKIAILGFGSRGQMFADFIREDGESLVAVVDVLQERLDDAKKFGVSKNALYNNTGDFFAAGKIADCVFICTPDRDHIETTLKALRIGYDILLEKPAAVNLRDCLEIRDTALQLKRKVMITHVLRYAHFFQEIKNYIMTGKLGEVVTINQTENVGFWHYAHSYVRGQWANSETSSPMILAKCCHDIDILCWLMGKECEKVSSYGNLNYFKQENAPKNSAKFCVDCHAKDCPYDAVAIYGAKRSAFVGNWLNMQGTPEEICKILADKSYPYGRCVFACNNNVVDHQVVNLLFEGGQTAHLTMTGFSAECHRTIKVHGTKGELYGDMEDQKLYYTRFGQKTQEIDLRNLYEDFSVHGGGDKLLYRDFMEFLNDGKNSMTRTTIEASIESHIICFLAEQSRLNEGKSIKIKND